MQGQKIYRKAEIIASEKCTQYLNAHRNNESETNPSMLADLFFDMRIAGKS